MICAKCGAALPLMEFGWIRLKKVVYRPSGQAIAKGRAKLSKVEGKWKYTTWKLYCKPCANKICNQKQALA